MRANGDGDLFQRAKGARASHTKRRNQLKNQIRERSLAKAEQEIDQQTRQLAYQERQAAETSLAAGPSQLQPTPDQLLANKIFTLSTVPTSSTMPTSSSSGPRCKKISQALASHGLDLCPSGLDVCEVHGRGSREAGVAIAHPETMKEVATAEGKSFKTVRMSISLHCC